MVPSTNDITCDNAKASPPPRGHSIELSTRWSDSKRSSRTPAITCDPDRALQLHARTATGLVNDREIARCLRHDREPLDLTAAAVLHLALTRPREERAREALRSPAGHAAAERLIAAGLLEDDRGVLRPTPLAEVTFRAPPDRRHLR